MECEHEAAILTLLVLDILMALLVMGCRDNMWLAL